jgi:thioredoxin reductase
VAIVGGGPIGLTAAAHLAARGLPFLVFESGPSAGAAVREWGHVAMFSPWRYTVDAVARQLLESQGWQAPDANALPTGAELVERYVAPLARHPAIAPHVRVNARVTAIGRKDFDKVPTAGRDHQPFAVHLDSGEIVEARAVIDASGTWSRPNPAGSGGVPAAGERENAAHVSYGIPDVTGTARPRFAGKRVLVVGSGHSAFNVILDLLRLADQTAGTTITWVLRRDTLTSVWGGGEADALEARGRLGTRVKQALEAGRLAVLSPYRIQSIEAGNGTLQVKGRLAGEPRAIAADEIIVCTGFRPDLGMLGEVRLAIDPALECTAALGPLIDPNEHSCGTVRPHGARELAHPERDLFVVGMKSYGRAPTFLLATGYEQVRSVAAFLAGDLEAAARVELELPETGVCSADTAAGGGCCEAPAVPVSIVARTAVPLSAAAQAITVAASSSGALQAGAAASATAAADGGCCGGPAPQGVEACCVKDADARAAGTGGCGCGTPAPVPTGGLSAG